MSLFWLTAVFLVFSGNALDFNAEPERYPFCPQASLPVLAVGSPGYEARVEQSSW